MQDIVVGGACADMQHQLEISYPVHNGIVQKWDDMIHVWDHVFFNELKVIYTSSLVIKFHLVLLMTLIDD